MGSCDHGIAEVTGPVPPFRNSSGKNCFTFEVNIVQANEMRKYFLDVAFLQTIKFGQDPIGFDKDNIVDEYLICIDERFGDFVLSRIVIQIVSNQHIGIDANQ